jgi:hypothetical protein
VIHAEDLFLACHRPNRDVFLVLAGTLFGRLESSFVIDQWGSSSYVVEMNWKRIE